MMRSLSTVVISCLLHGSYPRRKKHRISKSLVTILVATLCAGLFGYAEPAYAAAVAKVRDCPKRADCLPEAGARERIAIESDRLKFLDAKGGTTKELIFRASKTGELGGAVYISPDNAGAVITRWKAHDKGMEYLSHELLDANGRVVAELTGKGIPEALHPGPGFAFFVGWSSYMSSAGEPFVFFDAAGKVTKRVDGIFCAAGAVDCGGGVELDFPPTGSAIAIAVDGKGIAVFSSDGTLRWKRAIPGWSGRRRPYFFPSGDRFVIYGEVTQFKTDPRIKDGTLKWDDISKLPIEEKQKIFLPERLPSKGQGLYCYDINKESPVWFLPGWGGVTSMHQTEDLLAMGFAQGKDRFRVGLFNKDGLVRTWDVPRAKAAPSLYWINRHPVLMFEDISFPAMGGRTVEVRKKNGVHAIHIFDPGSDEPIWTKDGSERGFEHEPAGHNQFIISDETGESLFEVK